MIFCCACDGEKKVENFLLDHQDTRRSLTNVRLF
nr:MAG TPA: hypothetical protein [Caudoviricetes sp.]